MKTKTEDLKKMQQIGKTQLSVYNQMKQATYKGLVDEAIRLSKLHGKLAEKYLAIMNGNEKSKSVGGKRKARTN